MDEAIPQPARHAQAEVAQALGARRGLRVEHHTRYEYDTRVEVSYHMACLSPRNTPWQQVEQFSLSVDPMPAQREELVDSFGNRRHFLALYTPHEQLDLRTVAQVQVAARAVPLDAAASPPWESVVAAMRYAARAPMPAAVEFSFASSYVPLHPRFGAYARKSFAPGRPLLVAAIELMQRIHADFRYAAGSTDVSTPLLAVFDERRGVCQDFAHLMIGALRSLGLPARYVSGYLLTHPPPGRPRLVGVDASHAWIGVWCPLHGWVDLDPTNALVVDTSHVTLASGRDYGDVVPLRGVIRGGGEHELTVGVTVSEAD